MVKKEPPLKVEVKTLKLMPAAPGTCPECATDHEPNEPHNPDSLYYQVRFKMVHGRDPTDEDCVAHVEPSKQKAWLATFALVREVYAELAKKAEPGKRYKPTEKEIDALITARKNEVFLRFGIDLAAQEAEAKKKAAAELIDAALPPESPFRTQEESNDGTA
jgi:hypothetical protein